ncbi:ATP-binding protein [Streptosporangium sp. G11]|uniref:ATP-binding protein n=1 Tax=Streptosporangium sp. G11 TaxID=3436926 RepID=UPI003EBD02DD
MTVESLTVDDLDYLQRTGFDPPPVTADSPITFPHARLRRLLRIEGVGRLEKPHGGRSGDVFRLITNDLLVGLSNCRLPLAFMIGADGGRANVRIGTWLGQLGTEGELEENLGILRTALGALQPHIDVRDDGALRQWSLGGLVLGVPTAKPPDTPGDGLPYDRLLRAMSGTSWAALVLAEPVDEIAVRALRLRLLNEIRSTQTSARSTGMPSPLSEHYIKLLDGWVRALMQGQGLGAWRTAVYLLGEQESYSRLASVWRGVFAGEESAPEPVRVWDRPDVPELAARWALPDPAEGPAPGLFRHPYQHQTLLTSSQLSAYVHLPELETDGFAVSVVPAFDAATRPPASDAVIEVGAVVERGRPTASTFAIDVDRLTRHGLVTGVTGSGKTNTVFHLLRQLVRTATPFLVIEPAKTEYRALLRDDELGASLQVFTLGDEMVSPFRLNPLEVPDGIPVAVHLDLLRAVFSASFGMWTPLPQVLEVCLHEVYADRGWDITSNSNRRLDDASNHASASPTLTDLVNKVDEVAAALGYEERVTADIRAALRTRINSLRSGGKGRMLDVGCSLPIELLLERPTVLELQNMGDDDDKAFIMGLLLIRLAEQRRVQKDTEELRHLLVVEEAHRLLANPNIRRDETEADMRGKAVETFTHLLSEVRAYGQGVVVVEQIPTKLSPDIVKNTNLKLAHRIVAGDDRAVLAAAMAMNIRQELALATLGVGQAAAFIDGEDAPVLLQVPRVKGGTQTWPTDQEVRKAMAAPSDLPARTTTFARTADCGETCQSQPQACELALALTQDPEVMRTLARLILSAIQTPGGLQRTWPELITVVESRRPAWVAAEPLLRCLLLHGSTAFSARRGSHAGWTYADTEGLGLALRLVLESQLDGRNPDASVLTLRTLFLRLQGADHGPFPACATIWGERDGPCLCRFPVAELIADGGFEAPWEEATEADGQASEGRSETWALCQDAAYHLVEFPDDGQDPELAERLTDVARCTALCFGQQMLATRPWTHPTTQRRVLQQLVEEAGHA